MKYEHIRGGHYMELVFSIVCLAIVVLNIGYCIFDHE